MPTVITYNNASDLTWAKMINIYKYGSETVPANPIKRPPNSTTTVDIDMKSYMEGPGRYAHASDFSGIKKLFSGNSGIPISATGYTKSDLIKFGYSEDDFKLTLHHYLTDPTSADYGQRLIYNTAAYKISDNATFFVTASGVYVSNMAIYPYNDNFDMRSGDELTQALDTGLKLYVDPGFYGQKVTINFINKPLVPQIPVWGQTEFVSDQNIANLVSHGPGHAPDTLLTDAINDVTSLFYNNGSLVDNYHWAFSKSFENISLKISNFLDRLDGMADAIQDAISKFGDAHTLVCPLVLDLNNNGIELSAINKQGSVYWDGDNDGFREASGWVRGGDGLLVRDINGNGTIDNNSELFGNNATYTNGFLNLKSLDSNNDNLITSADANFGTLKVWVDANSDAVSQAPELFTLSSLGITQISLNAISSSQTISGNPITFSSTFVQNGVSKTIVDTQFVTDQTNSVFDGNYTLNTNALFVPSLRGYGLLSDLHVSMSQDGSLLTAMQNFSLKSLLDIINPTSTSLSDFKSLLFKWAGVENIVDGSRGIYVDAKELGFLEKFIGTAYTQTTFSTPNPNPNLPASNILSSAFDDLFSALYSKIAFQVVSSNLFTNPPSYDLVSDQFVGSKPDLNLSYISSVFENNIMNTANLGKAWNTLITILDTVSNVSNLSDSDKFALKNIIASSDPTGHITLDGLIASVHGTIDFANGAATPDIIFSPLGENGPNTRGGAGNDIIYGNGQVQTLTGEDGNDILVSDAGSRTLYGGRGDDIYYITDKGNAFITEYTIGTADGNDSIFIDGSYTSGQITTERTPNGVNKTWNMDVFANGVKIAEVENQFSNSTVQLEYIKLSNGSVIDLLSKQYTTNGTSSAETLHGIKAGANPDDIMNGLGGSDVLNGYEGNDRLNGGAGADTLYGGVGNDTYVIAAGEGGDTVNEELSGGNDTIEFTGTGLTNANLALFQSGNNLQIQFSGILYATVVNYYRLGGEIETIKFSDGSTKDMTSLDWTLLGTAAVDVLDATGGTGAGTHRDTIYGYAGADTIRGYAGNDTLYGGDGNDSISGGDQNDILYGENDVDTLRGENGDDRLDGGAGADLLYGGADNDTYVIVAGQGTDTIYEAGNGGKDTIEFTGDASWVLANFSAVNVSGNISLRFSGVEVAVINTGLSAGYEIENIKFNDGTVYNFSSYEWVRTGTASTESIGGGTGNSVDTIFGLAGNDTLRGYGGNDKLFGGDGNDTLYGGDDNDVLNGGLNDDIINGEAGIDTVTYSDATAAVTVNLATLISQDTIGAGLDTITNVENILGSSFNDTITGDLNANIIEGGAGDDILNGGAGADTLSYAAAAAGVTVDLTLATAQNTVGAGIDTISAFENIFGSANNDTLTGSTGNNVIEGGAGNDIMNGGTGTDTLSYASAASGITVSLALTTAQNTVGAGTDTVSAFENILGSAFNDTLTGSTGNNVIEGGAGNDVMNGGSGTDTLSYASAANGITVNLALTTAQNTGGAGTDTVTNFENILGSAYNDILTGSTANNVIDGGAGDDVIDAGAGTDTLTYASAIAGITVDLSLTSIQNTVGAGNDTVLNFENLTGSGFDDVLNGTISNNTIDAGVGNDVVYADLGDDILNGNTGTDTLSFNKAGSAITYNMATTTAQITGVGSDTITNFENAIGSSFNDTITGTTAANVIEGGLGNDLLDGAAGTDTLSYANSIAGVSVNLSSATAQNTYGAGVDTVSNFENLTGSAYDDRLYGTATANTIDGGLGDDIIYADLGNDILKGNTGIDTISFENIAANVTLNLATTTAQNTGTGSGSDTITGIENAIGSALNDTITGDANANVIEGGLGTDILNGAGGIDTVSYAHSASGVNVSLALATAQNTLGEGADTLSNFESLTGSNYDDILTGSSIDNTINGGAGNDLINGGAGNDILIGGSGIDTLTYADATTAVTVSFNSTGNQNTGSGTGSDNISGFENLIGGTVNDTLTGDGNNNTIEGGLGNDILNGSGGIDTVSYASATSGVTVNLSLTAAQNTGVTGSDTLSNFENIFASAFGDTLTGDGNANSVNGRAGADTLTGGLGADTFVFDATGFGTSDTVTDFSIAQGDKLDISAMLVGYNSMQSAIDDFITFTQAGANTTVSVDRDGAGTAYTAQNIASLTGVTSLDADTMLQNGNLIA